MKHDENEKLLKNNTKKKEMKKKYDENIREMERI